MTTSIDPRLAQWLSEAPSSLEAFETPSPVTVLSIVPRPKFVDKKPTDQQDVDSQGRLLWTIQVTAGDFNAQRPRIKFASNITPDLSPGDLAVLSGVVWGERQGTQSFAPYWAADAVTSVASGVTYGTSR